MPARFAPGATVYAKDGRSYIVESVEDGTVYCRSSAGAETEFAAAALLTASEWAARSTGRLDAFYARLTSSRVFAPPPGFAPDANAASLLVGKIDRLSPGLLDYAAVALAVRAARDGGMGELRADDLSIPKCRAAFDATPPAARVARLAELLGVPPAALLDAGRLGDNLMRALIEKGLAPQADAFEAFLDRPRR